MAMWKYTIQSGSVLHEAIYDGNTQQTIECLIQCYQELLNKLNKADKADYQIEIEDTIDALTYCDMYQDDEDFQEEINCYLEDFYDLCDSIRAFIKI